MRVVVIVAAAFALAACGSTSGPDAGAATPTPPSPQQPTATLPSPTETMSSPTETVASPTGTMQTGVQIISIAAIGAEPGGVAQAEANVTPGAVCDLDYRTPAGTESEAEGLSEQTAGADGKLRWEWRISPNTETGSAEVTLTCGDASETLVITIG